MVTPHKHVTSFNLAAAGDPSIHGSYLDCLSNFALLIHYNLLRTPVLHLYMITSLIVFYAWCWGEGNHISSIYKNLWRFFSVLDWCVDLLLASACK